MGGKGRKKGRGGGVPSGHADVAEPAAVADAGHDEDDDASTSDSEMVPLTEVEAIAPPPPPSAAAETTATVDAATSGGEPSGHADVAGTAGAEVEVVDDAATSVSETVAQPPPPIAHRSPSAAAETTTSVDVLGGVEAPPTEQGADITTSVSKLDEKPKELPAKKPQAAPADVMTPKAKKQLELVYIHCAMNMAVSILNFSTRSELLKEVLLKTGSNPKAIYADVAWYLSFWTGSTAFCEFFLNPTIGKLSDTYGRKPFMVAAPYAAIVLKAWVLASPSLVSLTVERIVCDGLRTLSGSTMGAAAVADLVPKSQLAKGFSGLWSRMGVAIIGGPLLASRLTARQSYKAAIFFAVLTLVNDQVFLEETLPEASKKPFTGIASPFSLAKLFTGSPTLALAAATMALQNLLDPKILADPWMVFQLDTLGWSRTYSQLFTAVIGLGLLAGSKLNTIGIDAMGLHMHTTMCHLTTVASNTLLGLFPSDVTQWAMGLAGFYGDQRTNGVKQMVANLAVKEGIAKGEMSGLTANLRALMVVFGPAIYSTAYTTGSKRGVPGAPFLAVAVVCALAELAHRRVKAAEDKDAEAQAKQA